MIVLQGSPIRPGLLRLDRGQAELEGMELNFIALRRSIRIRLLHAGAGRRGSAACRKPELVRRFCGRPPGVMKRQSRSREAAAILLENAPNWMKRWFMPARNGSKTTTGPGLPGGACRKRETWAGYTRWLYERGLIDELIDVDQAFTNDFLP